MVLNINSLIAMVGEITEYCSSSMTENLLSFWKSKKQFIWISSMHPISSKKGYTLNETKYTMDPGIYFLMKTNE